MEQWAEIRRRVLNQELSKRAACREYALHWKTLRKILEHVEPPGYQQASERAMPKLGEHLPFIHAVLEADRQAPRSNATRPSGSSSVCRRKKNTPAATVVSKACAIL